MSSCWDYTGNQYISYCHVQYTKQNCGLYIICIFYIGCSALKFFSRELNPRMFFMGHFVHYISKMPFFIPYVVHFNPNMFPMDILYLWHYYNIFLYIVVRTLHNVLHILLHKYFYFIPDGVHLHPEERAVA